MTRFWSIYHSTLGEGKKGGNNVGITLEVVEGKRLCSY